MNPEKKFQNRLNSLLEGVQIIDYDWRYVYLNDISIAHSKMLATELLGFTMMEKYPGIEQTPLFEVLQSTMNDRQTRRVENEFVFPDQSVQWFDLRIQPADEGICILSIDITEHKRSEEKINRGKNLYSFLSHINQSIVHLADEASLFRSACDAAISFGKFKMAWFGMFDEKYESITLVEQCGMPEQQLRYFSNATLSENSPQRHVIDSGTFFARNDIQNDLNHETLKEFAITLGIHSFVVLPLRKSGKIIGTFNLYSEKTGFAGNDEILLLEEVIADISFALTNFEREKKHRETERTLIENEKRFRALIEKGADMKTLATADGKLFYGSPSITKVLGYDTSQMMHVSLFDLIHPDDVGEFAKKRIELIKSPGESIEIQARMKHRNGRWIWCEGIATNMLEESGVHAIVSNFRDVSEKKAAEREAAFDRNNTKALINNTDDLMWSIDKDLNLITSNNAFDKMVRHVYGRTLERGEGIFQPGISAATRKQYEKAYAKALSGKSFRQNLRMVQPEGNWSEISFSPIVKDNEIIGVACHSRDITERMKTEKQLESQNKKLIKTNFELDRFVYSVSHDLRSPLTSIMGLVSFIEEESTEADTLKHAAMIRSGIDRLDGFIKNILNYSRNNRTDVDVKPIQLNEMVAEIVATLRHGKQAEDIDFNVNIVETIPFYSDNQSLITILENIISNAIKFRNKGADSSYVNITGHSGAQFLELSIADNGIGIEPQYFDKIFEMFFRPTSAIDGSGIGLYIVKEVINKLEGSIAVSAATGGGSVFHIRLKNLKP